MCEREDGRPLRLHASTGPRTCARGDDGYSDEARDVRRASTGPRTCARGDHRNRLLIETTLRVLQRGRALARAEILRLVPDFEPHRRASTGPRTCARGDWPERHRRAHAPHASTGPRTCARGDRAEVMRGGYVHTASTGPRTCARGDNPFVAMRLGEHVASTGPRTCARGDADCVRTWQATALRFNGAAHLRARRLGSNAAERARIGALQRGRALARAEILQTSSKQRSTTAASTGPRTCARGGRVGVDKRSRACFASTGPRTCARGDRAPDRSSERKCVCFNGAAHLRARR